MQDSDLPPIPPPAERLRLARQVGWLFTSQQETALRDKWSRECGDASRLIVHLIASPLGRASIRANGCTIYRSLSDAGRVLVDCISLEHGGHVRWHWRDDIIDVSRLSPEGSHILVRRILDPALWWSTAEVR